MISASKQPPAVLKREPESSQKNDGELSGDLDNVAGGVPTGPDVCKLPTQAGSTPMPYPNTGISVTMVADVLREEGFD